MKINHTYILLTDGKEHQQFMEFFLSDTIYWQENVR